MALSQEPTPMTPDGAPIEEQPVSTPKLPSHPSLSGKHMSDKEKTFFSKELTFLVVGSLLTLLVSSMTNYQSNKHTERIADKRIQFERYKLEYDKRVTFLSSAYSRLVNNVIAIGDADETNDIKMLMRTVADSENMILESYILFPESRINSNIKLITAHAMSTTRFYSSLGVEGLTGELYKDDKGDLRRLIALPATEQSKEITRRLSELKNDLLEQAKFMHNQSALSQ